MASAPDKDTDIVTRDERHIPIHLLRAACKGCGEWLETDVRLSPENHYDEDAEDYLELYVIYVQPCINCGR